MPDLLELLLAVFNESRSHLTDEKKTTTTTTKENPGGLREAKGLAQDCVCGLFPRDSSVLWVCPKLTGSNPAPFLPADDSPPSACVPTLRMGIAIVPGPPVDAVRLK